MPELSRELESLHALILKTPVPERCALQPALDDLIARMERAGIKVPVAIRSLNDELCDEAIEAQFENMPV